MAEQALEAIKSSHSGTLREQAYLLMSAMQGWRGPRASQVHEALKSFVEGDDESP
jgi:hypothetical protein